MEPAVPQGFIMSGDTLEISEFQFQGLGKEGSAGQGERKTRDWE